MRRLERKRVVLFQKKPKVARIFRIWADLDEGALEEVLMAQISEFSGATPFRALFPKHFGVPIPVAEIGRI